MLHHDAFMYQRDHSEFTVSDVHESVVTAVHRSQFVVLANTTKCEKLASMHSCRHSCHHRFMHITNSRNLTAINYYGIVLYTCVMQRVQSMPE